VSHFHDTVLLVQLISVFVQLTVSQCFCGVGLVLRSELLNLRPTDRIRALKGEKFAYHTSTHLVYVYTWCVQKIKHSCRDTAAHSFTDCCHWSVCCVSNCLCVCVCVCLFQTAMSKAAMPSRWRADYRRASLMNCAVKACHIGLETSALDSDCVLVSCSFVAWTDQ